MNIDTIGTRIDSCQYVCMTELCCPPVTSAVLDEGQAAALAALLKALADPVRIRLVSLLSAAPGGELCACDLPGVLGRSQSTVSHHLSLLVDAGVLAREQRGKWAWFRLRPERLEALSAALSASAAGAPAAGPR